VRGGRFSDDRPRDREDDDAAAADMVEEELRTRWFEEEYEWCSRKLSTADE